MKALKYRKNYKKNYEGHFKFYDTDSDLPDGKTAKKVTVKFSGYASPYFIYDADKKVIRDTSTEEPILIQLIISSFHLRILLYSM